jgi:NRPS condensation-like uncharacterized protein
MGSSPSEVTIPAQLLDVALRGGSARYGDLCIHAVLDLRRNPTRAELERAYLATVRDFPVLGCRYREGLLRDRWVPERPDPQGSVFVGASDDVEAETSTWLERGLSARPFRVVMLHHAGGCRLIVSLLHLAVDGAGVAAVGHVLACHLVGCAPSLPVDARRGVLDAVDGLPLRSVPFIARAVLSHLAVPLRELMAAPRERPYSRDHEAHAAYRHLVFDAEQLRRARASLGSPRVNDLLVAVLAVAAGRRSTGGPVVVTYTMDLRRYARSPRLSTANTSSLLTAVVPRADVSTLARATAAVRTITRRQRGALHGPAYLVLPHLLAGLAPHSLTRRLAPVIGPLFADLPLSRGLLLTNVGRVDDGLAVLGEDLVALRIVGPTIRGLDVPIVVAYGFRGALHLQLFAGPGVGPVALGELEAEIVAALNEA